MKTPLAPCALPESAAPVTVGAMASVALPSTTASPSVMSNAPRPSAASLPRASRMVPPFSESAEAPMESPSGSESVATTV